jgi:polynucleotide 5'-kinase involved in rRNA processing
MYIEITGFLGIPTLTGRFYYNSPWKFSLAEWEELFDELRKQKCTGLFIGTTDSGKTTLVKYLAKRLIKETIKVSIVDTDVGQATLGLLGTISMNSFQDLLQLKHIEKTRC